MCLRQYPTIEDAGRAVEPDKERGRWLLNTIHSDCKARPKTAKFLAPKLNIPEEWFYNPPTVEEINKMDCFVWVGAVPKLKQKKKLLKEAKNNSPKSKKSVFKTESSDEEQTLAIWKKYKNKNILALSKKLIHIDASGRLSRNYLEAIQDFNERRDAERG